MCVLKSSFLWYVKQSMLVVVYRRFGIACQSHFQGSSSPRRISQRAFSCSQQLHWKRKGANNTCSFLIISLFFSRLRFHPTASSGNHTCHMFATGNHVSCGCYWKPYVSYGCYWNPYVSWLLLETICHWLLMATICHWLLLATMCHVATWNHVSCGCYWNPCVMWLLQESMCHVVATGSHVSCGCYWKPYVSCVCYWKPPGFQYMKGGEICLFRLVCNIC
jgi:hypothetical protein